jgi:hypothetical protein
LYADYNAELVDTLRVLVPTDCSATYQTLYEKYGQELAVTFNLLEKEERGVQIYYMQGKIMGSHPLPNTLNQTYALAV